MHQSIERQCILCTKKSQQNILLSTSYSAYFSDLDLRTPSPHRETLAQWVEFCPHCNYCAENISQEIKGAKDIVVSKDYQNILQQSTLNIIARKFLALAFIYEVNKQAFNSIHYTHCAAWACDDAKDIEGAIVCRNKVIALAKKNNYNMKENHTISLIVLVDLMRRNERFDEALIFIEKLKNEKNIPVDVKEVMFHQTNLIAKKDVQAYSLYDLRVSRRDTYNLHRTWRYRLKSKLTSIFQKVR